MGLVASRYGPEGMAVMATGPHATNQAGQMFIDGTKHPVLAQTVSVDKQTDTN